MTYINAISSISYQNFLEEKNSSLLKKLDNDATLIEPVYKQWISPMQLRRMSKIVKMGIGCTKDILQQLNIENTEKSFFESIIVGTGLGCIKDTIKFLDVINSVSTSSIPPTAFIQSTHNTIAGQMALLLKNNNYNMTYVQNGVSFEHALLDGHLKILEGKNNVLVGGVDEMIDYLKELAAIVNFETTKLTEGSAFFNLSSRKTESTYATLSKTMTFTCTEDFSLNRCITSFLASENINIADIDLVLETSDKFNYKNKFRLENKDNIIAFEEYSGSYFTSSAFAIFLACILFKEDIKNINQKFSKNLEKLDYVLIINNYLDKEIGLTLLTK